MSIDITRIEIKIPDKGSVFLVEKETEESIEDAFEGDDAAIKFLYTIFDKAEKEKLTYSYADHSRIVEKRVTKDDIFNCDAIRDVLTHNGIEVPEDFPTYSSRLIALEALAGFDVEF